MADKYKYSYNFNYRDLILTLVVFILITSTLLLISLHKIHIESVNIQLLFVVPLMSVILGVFIHEFIHWVGYKLARSSPDIKFKNMNPYVTNLNSNINLKHKLLIDAAPSIFGVILFLIFTIAFYISDGIVLLISISLAILNASIVAPSTLDWKTIYEINSIVEDCSDFEIKHKIVKEQDYPVAIISPVTDSE